MSQRILLAYSQINFVYTLLTVLAPSLFLAYYVGYLFAHSRQRRDETEMEALPFWLNFLYPNWLDRLTIGGILRAFVQAIGMALLSFAVKAVVFLLVVGKILVR